jgi:replicative DNA helicase
VIVDYLQLVSARGKFGNRNEEVSSITRGLKALAKELKVPMLVLSQLTRAPEREDRRRTLADLRESGAIEQDADVVMFIHRPNAFKKTDEAPKSAPRPSSDHRQAAQRPHRRLSGLCFRVRSRALKQRCARRVDSERVTVLNFPQGCVRTRVSSQTATSFHPKKVLHIEHNAWHAGCRNT